MQTMMQRLYRPDQYERQAGDFYPTPAWVTLCLLDTVPLRGIVLEPCAGQGAMAKVIADAGHQVIATDLIEHDSCIFPIVPGVDALQASLPAGVQTILTNPPYRRDLLPRLVERWLEILNPVGGKLCLLLRSLWGESQSGQALTTRHPAYAGRVKLPRRIRWFAGTDADKGDSPQHDHCWLVWDWSRDPAKLPFDLSSSDPRLKGCQVCGASLAHLRDGAKTCSVRCRMKQSRRRAALAHDAGTYPDAPENVCQGGDVG